MYLFTENSDLKNVFLNLQSVVKFQKKVSKLQIDMAMICLNILDMISECYNSYSTNNATKLKAELLDQIKLLCKIFETKKSVMLKISKQQQTDAVLEIRRLNAIVQLAKLLSHSSYDASKSNPSVLSAFKAANAAVFNHALFNEADTTDKLNKLQQAVKVSGVVTQQERDLIVKAIGVKAGAWYKCPNGHLYCIGDCGGAMEEGRCPECAAKIGGRSHRLLANNAHAPEMDGSKYPAWPQEANNMANYDMNL